MSEPNEPKLPRTQETPGDPPQMDLFSQLTESLECKRNEDLSAEKGTPQDPTRWPAISGRYELIERYGVGGLGEVWKALDRQIQRVVAVKVIRPARAGDPFAIERFRREAIITGRLNHPNIVPVHEYRAEGDGEPFYVMRFVVGRTFHKVISAYWAARSSGYQSIAFRELLGQYRDICNAVSYAHSQGVIHRDLKPDNVVIGDYGEVIVLDWGLAKIEKDAEDTAPGPLPVTGSPVETQIGAVLGSAGYMAPEQAAGRVHLVNRATDIYALGGILFHVATGQPPHRRLPDEDSSTFLARLAAEPVRRADQVQRTIPRPLNAIISRALAFQQGDRYTSAGEIAADVERWLADERVTVYREHWWERSRRLMRRHRAWATGGVTLLISAVIFLAAVAMIADRARRNSLAELEQTSQQRQRADQNLATARRVLDGTLGRLGDEELSALPGLDRTRHEILLAMLGFYDQLLQGNEERPELHLETADTLLKIGQIQVYLNREDEAIRSYQRARDLLAPAPDQPLPGPPTADLLAEAYWRLAHVTAEEPPEQLELKLRLFGQAEDIWAVLHAEDPNSPRFLSKLAETRYGLALTLRTADRIPESRAKFEQALQLQQQLVDLSENDPPHHYMLARIHNSFAEFHFTNQENELGIRDLEIAMELLAPLVESEERFDYMQELGFSYCRLGCFYLQQQEFDKAEPMLRKGMQLRGQLSNRHPDLPYLKVDCAGATTNLAVILLMRKNPQEALELLEQSKSLLTSVLEETPDDETAAQFMRVTEYQITQARQQLSATQSGDSD